MKLSALIFGLVFMMGAHAAELKIQKVKEIGVMKNKVIFQSKDVKRVNKSNIVKGKIVAQWGTEVFEVLTGLYSCNTKNVCKLVDHERVATYKLCVVKGQKAVCSQKISGVESASESRDIIVAENPDAVTGDYDHSRDNNEYSEFPVRIQDEYSDLF